MMNNAPYLKFVASIAILCLIAVLMHLTINGTNFTIQVMFGCGLVVWVFVAGLVWFTDTQGPAVRDYSPPRPYEGDQINTRGTSASKAVKSTVVPAPPRRAAPPSPPAPMPTRTTQDNSDSFTPFVAGMVVANMMNNDDTASHPDRESPLMRPTSDNDDRKPPVDDTVGRSEPGVVEERSYTPSAPEPSHHSSYDSGSSYSSHDSGSSYSSDSGSSSGGDSVGGGGD